jgi:hypothetical protein
LHGETWWIDDRFSGAKNMPLYLNISVENLGDKQKADPPATRKDDNKKATATTKATTTATATTKATTRAK